MKQEINSLLLEVLIDMKQEIDLKSNSLLQNITDEFLLTYGTRTLNSLNNGEKTFRKNIGQRFINAYKRQGVTTIQEWYDKHYMSGLGWKIRNVRGVGLRNVIDTLNGLAGYKIFKY